MGLGPSPPVCSTEGYRGHQRTLEDVTDRGARGLACAFLPWPHPALASEWGRCPGHSWTDAMPSPQPPSLPAPPGLPRTAEGTAGGVPAPGPGIPGPPTTCLGSAHVPSSQLRRALQPPASELTPLVLRFLVCPGAS